MNPKWPSFKTQPVAAAIAALIAGSIYPLGMAPMDLWPLTLCSIFLIAWLARNHQGSAFWLGWWYGLGLFGVGASWVSASMEVAGTPAALRLVLTSLFCMGLALLYGVQIQLFAHLRTPRAISASLSFAALWLVFEWLRSWLFTGFPWLYAGYALLDTWAAGWAPLIGVYGLSTGAALLSSAWAFSLSKHDSNARWTTLVFSLILLALSAYLDQKHWVTVTGKTVDTAIVQGNVNQATKWDLDQIEPHFERYLALSMPHVDAALIVWPEAAITAVQSRAGAFINTLNTLGQTTQTTFITGLISDPVINQRRVYHNSAVALGQGSGSYDKTRMVPFGEYVPFASLIRGLFAFFDLPLSTLEPGQGNASPLQAEGALLGMLICYEIAYPSMALDRALVSDILVTLSNDAWFGLTFGPYQHLQMVRMRALEVGRPVIRATQDGISAFIDHQGVLNTLAPKHQQRVIRYQVELVRGTTPYVRWGYVWMLALATGWLGLAGFKRSGAASHGLSEHSDR